MTKDGLAVTAFIHIFTGQDDLAQGTGLSKFVNHVGNQIMTKAVSGTILAHL
jgi:hypothetical protein